jgi:hypothetical protein
MSSKNEYFDNQNGNGIYEDEKFAKETINKIKQQYELVSSTDLKTAINNLKQYSDLPNDLHEKYANSNFINDLYEYYKYLQNKFNMTQK